MVGITVVVPVWNGRAFLAKALNSVRQQEKSPWPVQLIVVEDGTPAGADSEDIAQAYHAEYHYLWPNQGVAHARRYGAGLSVFDEGYLSFLDQDDFWYPPFLFQMTDALSRDSSKGFAVSNADVIFPSGAKYRLYQTKFPSLRLPDLKMFNHIVTPSQVLMRLSSFRRSGWTGVLESPGADDWLLWLTLYSKGCPGVYVPIPLMAYLEHEAGAHRDLASMRQSEAGVVRDWFGRLGFSQWDQRRYWAGVSIERSLHMASHHQWGKFFGTLSSTACRDPRAAVSAAWYRVERKLKHWV